MNYMTYILHTWPPYESLIVGFPFVLVNYQYILPGNASPACPCLFSLHSQALIPALFQQAESIVPSLCAGSLYPIAISSWMLRRLLICSPPHRTRKECLLFFKEESPGTLETMEEERDPDSKPSGATESSLLFFSTKILGLL